MDCSKPIGNLAREPYQKNQDKMYSPKIHEDLIPDIYKLSKATQKPMTKVVDEIIGDYLSKIEIKEEKVMRDEMISRQGTTYKIIKNGN